MSGLVTVLAVLQGLALHPLGAWQGAVILLGTMLAVALVEAYAHTIASLLSQQGRLARDDMREIARNFAPFSVVARGEW